MNPIVDLKEEHQAVNVTLKILMKISLKLSQNQEIDLDLVHLDQLLEFLTTFVDKCHHGKEEDILFPALEKVGIPREGGPIGVMLHEHDLGRGYVRNIRQGAMYLKAGDKKGKALIIENIEYYNDLLIQHIDKEDHILYPIAEQRFSREQNSELFKGFSEIEDKRIGAGKHEEFHQMLHRLQEVYLG